MAKVKRTRILRQALLLTIAITVLDIMNRTLGNESNPPIKPALFFVLVLAMSLVIMYTIERRNSK